MIGDVRNQRRKINNIPPSSIYGELHNQLNVESSNPSFFFFPLDYFSFSPAGVSFFFVFLWRNIPPKTKIPGLKYGVTSEKTGKKRNQEEKNLDPDV